MAQLRWPHWFIYFLNMVFRFILLAICSLTSLSSFHDFYISICYIKSVDGELQINYRVFKDDAQIALGNPTLVNEDFCSNIADYIVSHFGITEDSHPLHLVLKDCTYEGSGKFETVSCLFVAEDHQVDAGELKINSSVLLDVYDDQVNMIHVQMGDTKKSMNLDRDRKSFSLPIN